MAGNSLDLELKALVINAHPVSAPDKWDEVSCETWVRILKEWEPEKPIKERSEIKLFSILTGTSYESIFDSKDYYIESLIYSLVSCIYNDDFTDAPIPETITVGGKTIKIPRNLGKLSIGQNSIVRKLCRQTDLLTGKPIDTNLILPTVTAIYLQPLYDAKPLNGDLVTAQFDYDRAMELEKEILKMPITEIYPIGFFFLNLLRLYGTGWRRLLGQTRHRLMSAGLHLQSWLSPRNLTLFLKSLL